LLGYGRLLKASFILLFLFVTPMAYCAISFNGDITIITRSGGGELTFEQNFTANTVTFSNNSMDSALFNMGTEWDLLGVDCPADTNMSVISVTSTRLMFSFEADASKSIVIGVGTKGIPNSVLGGDSWSYDSVNALLEIIVSSDDIITITWDEVSTGTGGGTWGRILPNVSRPYVEPEIQLPSFSPSAMTTVIIFVLSAYLVLDVMASRRDKKRKSWYG